MSFVVVEIAVGSLCIAVVLILFCCSLLDWVRIREENDARRRANSRKQLYIYL